MEFRKLITSGQVLISYPPHVWGRLSTIKVMYIVLATLLLPTGAAIYFFGLSALWIILVSTLTAVLVEFSIKKLRKKRFIMDGSAVMTGLLLALILPPRMPLWMVFIGSAFSIAIVKEAFGGLGHNIFNPALAGRAFLAVCFPVQMTAWYMPGNFAPDALTSATPLSDSYLYEGTRLELYRDMFFGNIAGSIGETSAALIITGGIILIALRLIDWRIPLVFLGTVAAGSFILGNDVIFQLLAGGLMLGAFFMATDYVTSPVTPSGRAVFAFGAGIVTLLIRNFSSLPEGVAFSILIMNSFTPLIDKYIRLKPFGYIRPKSSGHIKKDGNKKQ